MCAVGQPSLALPVNVSAVDKQSLTNLLKIYYRLV